MDDDFFIGKKLNIFVFTLCIWTHLWKILIIGSYTLRKTFFIFSSKKLDVVTITRYQITFWIFDFSLLEILPKYMNPKIVLRTLYALDDLPKIADTGRVRTDGHRFLNVCHTRAPKGAIIYFDPRWRLGTLITRIWISFFRILFFRIFVVILGIAFASFVRTMLVILIAIRYFSQILIHFSSR